MSNEKLFKMSAQNIHSAKVLQLNMYNGHSYMHASHNPKYSINIFDYNLSIT